MESSTSSSKKYVYLYNVLASEIQTGKYTKNTKLPSEMELMNRFGYSRQTVRSALKLLETNGFIRTVRGSGSFVASHINLNKKTNRIAYISIRIVDYIFPDMLSGVEEVLSASGYSPQLFSTSNSLRQEQRILNLLKDEPVDGIIITGTKTVLPNPNLALFREFADAGVPIVFMNNYYPSLQHENIVHVVMDDYQGGYDLASFLFNQGITDIGCIFNVENIQGHERYHGLLSAFTDHSIEFDDTKLIWFAGENITDYTNMDAVCARLKNCEAILCYNDAVARSLLKALNHEDCPRLKYICSFDHCYPLEAKDAECISLHHAGKEIGLQAAKKLVNMLNGITESSEKIPWRFPG